MQKQQIVKKLPRGALRLYLLITNEGVHIAHESVPELAEHGFKAEMSLKEFIEKAFVFSKHEFSEDTLIEINRLCGEAFGMFETRMEQAE